MLIFRNCEVVSHLTIKVVASSLDEAFGQLDTWNLWKDSARTTVRSAQRLGNVFEFNWAFEYWIRQP